MTDQECAKVLHDLKAYLSPLNAVHVHSQQQVAEALARAVEILEAGES